MHLKIRFLWSQIPKISAVMVCVNPFKILLIPKHDAIHLKIHRHLMTDLWVNLSDILRTDYKVIEFLTPPSVFAINHSFSEHAYIRCLHWKPTCTHLSMNTTERLREKRSTDTESCPSNQIAPLLNVDCTKNLDTIVRLPSHALFEITLSSNIKRHPNLIGDTHRNLKTLCFCKPTDEKDKVLSFLVRWHRCLKISRIKVVRYHIIVPIMMRIRHELGCIPICDLRHLVFEFLIDFISYIYLPFDKM